MKKDLHPTNYRPVVFQDTSNNSTFLISSTAETDETIKLDDGNEYPLVKIHISSESHPFYTGKEKLVDIEGRVDRFKAQAERAKKNRKKLASSAAKKTARKAKVATKNQQETNEEANDKPATSKKSKQKKASK